MADGMDTEGPALGGQIKRLLDSQVQCVLATLAVDRPAQHLMAYARDDSLRSIYLASLADTAKVANMTREPAVSLLWDNRRVRGRDHVEGLALTASGRAQRLEAEALASGRERLLQRNGSLARLLENAGAVVFRVDVERYHLVRGYSEQYDYHPAA
jgi:hypothetical protein